jgi:serpin B
MTTHRSTIALAAGLLLTLAATAVSAQPLPDPVADSTRVASGNTQFTVDLYGRLAAQEGNLFFSPFSISSALAMTSAGARGNTEVQMVRVLHLQMEGGRLHPAFSALTGSLNRDGQTRVEPNGPPAFELVVANALWGQQGYPFKPDFQDLLKRNYGSELRTVDFERATEQARVTINTWVATQTRDKIQDLIAPGILQPITRLVLTNAIYFKANWQDKFEKSATTDRPFNLAPGRSVQVPMMRQTRSYGYFESPTLQAVELPYVMNRLSMVLLVPRQIDGLAAVEKELPANLATWLGGLKPRRVDLSLPRFKTTSSFSLSRELKAMGMTDAFDGGLADFSGMTTMEKLFIGEVLHKAYVDVNEEGTEAAAATAVLMLGGAMPPRDPPVVVTANRPFLFLIRHTASGSILFMGRLAKPEGGQAGQAQVGPRPGDPMADRPNPARRGMPAPIQGRPANPQAATKVYIVTYDASVDPRAETARLEAAYAFKASYVYTAAMRGFAAPLTDDQAEKIRWEPSILALQHDAVIQLRPPGGPQ